jgi:hypothetical protein
MPDLENDDLRAALTYAARRLDHPIVAAWSYAQPSGIHLMDIPEQSILIRI